ncbi:MAG: O-antigen ligase family protein [Lachnospiraceae bacterium]
MFVLWKILSAGIIIFLLGIDIWNRTKISKMILAVSLFEISILFSTYYQQGYMSRAVIDAVSMISIVSLMILGIKYNPKGMIGVLNRIITVLMFINLIIGILYPKGLPGDLYITDNEINKLFFMFIDNGSVQFLIFCILVSTLNSLLKTKRISLECKFVNIACLVTALMSESATAIFCILLLLLFMVLIYKTDIERFLNPGLLSLIYGIFVLSIFLKTDDMITGFILETFLHRSGDFTGRSFLWGVAWNMIIKHPVIGYGRQLYDYIPSWGTFMSSHNFFLEILLQGGFLALSLMLTIFGMCVNRISNISRGRISNYIFMSLWILMIACMFEATVHSVYLFIILVLTFCSGELERLNERNM